VDEQEKPTAMPPFAVDRARLKAVLDRSQRAREKSQKLIAKSRASRDEIAPSTGVK
jgi:hypothetical protein